MSLFQITKKIGRLTYKLKIPDDWKIYLVFLVAQLESTPEPFNDSFWRFYSHYLPTLFDDNDNDSLKSFEIYCLLNKKTMKRSKGLTVEYLVCWTGYDLE